MALKRGKAAFFSSSIWRNDQKQNNISISGVDEIIYLPG